MSVVILGAGVTGLAAGVASGAPVFEAAATPGGICSSYYVRPGTQERLHERPRDGDAYRFEIGGGHWIFGGDSITLAHIGRLTSLRSYARRSSVYFPDERLAVPYPIQNHLHALGKDVVARALAEMARPLPVCADESCHTRADLPGLAGRYDMVNVKLDKAGGLTEALALRDAARAAGFGVMVGCMVGTSLGMAPAVLVAQAAAVTDLDGPLLLARDRAHPLVYDERGVHPASPELWG